MNLVLFLLLALIWGGSFLAIKLVVEVWPVFAAAATRVWIATLVAVFFVIWQQRTWPRQFKVWFAFLGLGILGMGLPWALLFWGQQHVAPALSSILNSSVPIFVVLLSAILLRRVELLSWQKCLGVGVGFVGIFVIFYPALGPVPGLLVFKSDETLLAMVAILCMAISYAAHIVLLKRMGGVITMVETLAIQGIGAFVFLLLISLAFETYRWPPLWSVDSLKAILSLLYLGILSTYLGWRLFFRLIDSIGAVRAGAVTFLVPLVAIVLDLFYYGVWPRWNQMGGTALIFFGLSMIHYQGLSRHSLAPDSSYPQTPAAGKIL